MIVDPAVKMGHRRVSIRHSHPCQRSAHMWRVALAFTTGPESFTAVESNRNGGISNCNVIRHERGEAGVTETGVEEWVEDREKEAAGRRIKNARPERSRGFHLTE